MIIYKDAFTGDELLSDTFPMKLIDDVIYEVKGKMVTESYEIDESAIGGNPSAEGGCDEGVDSSATTSINIVLNHRLQEYGLDKKSYMGHIKEYMKKVKSRVADNCPQDMDAFQKNAQIFVKKVLGEFKEYQLYCGESMGDGMLILLKWDETTPYFYYFKHGLEEEKV